jgi:hypothetical protein
MLSSGTASVKPPLCLSLGHPYRCEGPMHGARSSTEIYIRLCHWFPRLFA